MTDERITTNAMLREQDARRIEEFQRLIAAAKVAHEYEMAVVCADLLKAQERHIERDALDEQQAHASARLVAELAETRKDAERWKERAEYEYAQRVYPDKPGLAWGALDAHMKTWRWVNKQADIDAAIAAKG